MSRIEYVAADGFPDTMPNPDSSSWATFCPTRSPEFKVHTTKGLAHSALAYRSLSDVFALYELVGGNWTKRLEYRPPEVCPRCGEVPKTRYSERWVMPDTGPRVWQGGIPHCRDCEDKDTELKREWKREEQERQQYLKLKEKFEADN